MSHYGSTNETYKIAYEKQAFSPRARKYEFCQVWKLPSFEKTSHSVLVLWILSWEKSNGLGKKVGKEAKES